MKLIFNPLFILDCQTCSMLSRASDSSNFGSRHPKKVNNNYHHHHHHVVKNNHDAIYKFQQELLNEHVSASCA
jgi:hypothetical protein